MTHELLQRPDFGLIKVTFDAPGEAIVAESGAMVARDTPVRMDTSLRGGLLAAAKRKALGGESLFLNTFTASAAGETLYLAPAPEGDVEHRRLGAGEVVFLQSSCYVASTPGVKVDTKWGGAKGFFSGTGMFLIRAEGPGDLFFSAYGGIHPVDVTGGYVVDTDHVVGFEAGLDYRVRKSGGLKSLFLSGEGLVCEFRGAGRLWVQTRNPSAFAAWLNPFRPKKAKSGD